MNWFSRSWKAYDVDGPARVLPILNGLKETLSPVVRIRPGKFCSLLVVQGLESFVGRDVDLGVNVASVFSDVFEGVTGVSVHVVEPIWSSAVGEEDQNLVNRFRVLRQVILYKSIRSVRLRNLYKILKSKRTQNISASFKCV